MSAGTVVRVGATPPAIGAPARLGDAGPERFLRAPRTGRMRTLLRIGDTVRSRDPVGDVDGEPLAAPIDGVVRGLSARGARVGSGQIVAEIDPRGDDTLCHGLDPRGIAIAAGVLEALRDLGLARDAAGEYRPRREPAPSR